MRRYLLLMISVIIFLPCSAKKGISIPTLPDGFSEKEENLVNLGNMFESDEIQMQTYKFPSRNAKISSDGNAGEVKALFTFPPYGEEWMLSNVAVFSESGYFIQLQPEPYDKDWNIVPITEMEFEIPEGTYDIVAYFNQKEEECSMGQSLKQIYYIKESVDISENTVIDLKPELCVNRLVMQSRLPDGEELTLSSYHYDGTNMQLIKEGNVTTFALFHSIIVEDLGTVAAFFMQSSRIIESGVNGYWKTTDAFDFYVNDVSSRYIFRSYFFSVANEEKGTYASVSQCQGVDTKIHTNGDYVLEDSKISPTPLSSKYPVPDEILNGTEDSLLPYMTELGICKDYENELEILRFAFYNNNDNVWKVWLSKPKEDTSDNPYLTVVKTLKDAYISPNKIGEIQSPYVFPLASTGITSCVVPFGMLANTPYYNVQTLPYPGITDYMSVQNKDKIISGESAPQLISSLYGAYDIEFGKMCEPFWFSYQGRINDRLYTDEIAATGKICFKGKEVGTLAETSSWLVNNTRFKGKREIYIETDNFEIDGYKGGNRGEVVFDNSKDDMIPPSVTMLQFKDADGGVTQIFDIKDQITMLVSAADFTLQYGEPDETGLTKWWLEPIVPKFVKAEISPYGREEYKNISLEAIPENFDKSGFGALYKSDLSGIIHDAYTGWYDLRLTVEDAAGNYQKQTISPAFKIADNSGIRGNLFENGNIRIDNKCIYGEDILEVELYDMKGNIVCHSKNMTELPSGIYIIKIVVPDQSIIKKIIL